MQTFIGDNDYRRTLLAEWCRQCGVEIWAYCLMPNHVHLIAVPLCDDSLRRGQGRPRYEIRSMPKRPPKKRAPEQLAPDSDEHFAHIAGYTAGGAPYGVTWEEMEALERREAAARSLTPPPQMEPVPLNEIAQEMQMVSDTMTVYFKCTTGEFVAVTDEYVYAAEDDDPLDGRPEWEQEAVRTIAEFLAHEDDGTYVPLPSRYDIHEYAIMERFCETITNKKIANDLFRAISGKGAFRRFKDAIHRHGIQENWYRFKDYAYREIAREWCEEHGLTWRE